MLRTSTLETEPTFREARLARSMARSTFEGEGLERELLDSLILVTSELFTNAVEAGDAARPIMVVFNVSSDSIEVRVTNYGPALRAKRLGPDDGGSRGRGLLIAKRVGSVSVRHKSGRTTVSVRVNLDGSLPGSKPVDGSSPEDGKGGDPPSPRNAPGPQDGVRSSTTPGSELGSKHAESAEVAGGADRDAHDDGADHDGARQPVSRRTAV